VSLVDAAMPGMLPVPNKECIRQAVRTGLALEAVINRWSRFDRKNYFYADLPQGYQISQLFHPLVGPGEVEILTDEKDETSAKQIGIERIHVEQDAGKLMHDQHPTMSYVDLNRAGVALMEIVSRPDMRSPAEAGAYLRKLRAILRYVGSCDGNMEEGSMRADVNVSVRKPGGEFGTRTETKNVNSVRFVMAVVEHEAKRQVELLESGGAVAQETRLYDPDKNVTRSLRSKEDAHDYRYFPDPDLLPLELDEEFIAECRASLPELPDDKRKRYEGHGITPYNASVLTAEVETARWFDALLEAGAEPKQASNWVVAELFGALNRRGESIIDTPISPEEAAELLKLVADGTISGTIAKQVFEIMLESGEPPSKIVEERGLRQTSDTGAIDAEIDQILAANADKVAEYKSGKQQLFGFFVGQTMKAMQGKANPQVVNERLRAKLG
jgi:aspartyl-tRNA(Asn)/glutamyl-tRNA(Gln) amidotransferase subunit B